MVLFKRHRELSTRAFIPGIYDNSTSLADTIERLSDKKREISDREVFNLVVKYFVNFILEGLEYEKIPEGETHKWYLGIQKFTKEKCGEGKDSIPLELNVIRDIYYQLSILGCPSTISIVKHIISQKTEDILGNREYRSLDLGAGSAILQTAFYIKGRRSNLVPSMKQSIGIELKDSIAQRSNRILHRLGVGRVVTGDTTKIETYEKNNIPDIVHDVGNENLTNAFSPLYINDENQEPFLQNLRVLRKHFGNLETTHIFPEKTLLWVKEEARGREIPYSFPVLMIGPNFEDSLQRIENQEVQLRSSGNFQKIESYLYPESAELGKKVISLEQIGDRYLFSKENTKGYFYPSDFMPRRWVSDPVGAAHFFR